jgi:hypothetical protein
MTRRSDTVTVGHVMAESCACVYQLAARGTEERARLGWPFFGRDFFYLENYDVSWGNDCFKRKKTP